VDGPVPLPDQLPDVRWRAGLDLHPLHAHSDTDRDWLRTLIWPEHRGRLNRLPAALDIVAADPPRIDTADAIDGLPALIDAAPSDCTVVVFHSAVLAYLAQGSGSPEPRCVGSATRGLVTVTVWSGRRRKAPRPAASRIRPAPTAKARW